MTKQSFLSHVNVVCEECHSDSGQSIGVSATPQCHSMTDRIMLRNSEQAWTHYRKYKIVGPTGKWVELRWQHRPTMFVFAVATVVVTAFHRVLGVNKFAFQCTRPGKGGVVSTIRVQLFRPILQYQKKVKTVGTAANTAWSRFVWLVADGFTLFLTEAFINDGLVFLF